MITNSIEKLLLETPISLLGGFKIAHIEKIFKDNNISNFLEIGTWIGGTVYLLSNKWKNIKFETLDINDFNKMYAENTPLVNLMETWLNQSITANDLKDLQFFYRLHSFNAHFHDVDDFNWDDKTYNCILIDGDHSANALRSDLIRSFEHVTHKGFILIDDVAFNHIRKEILSFCKLNHQKCSFTSYEPGKDLAIIKINKKIKKNRLTRKIKIIY